MLIRRAAVPLVTALLLGLAPPLAGDASAAAPAWATRVLRDFLQGQRVSRGQGVTIALLGDGVASGVGTLDGAVVKGRDLVRTRRPSRLTGTVMASLLVGGGATRGSALGIRGLASGAKVMPVRIHPGPDEPGADAWWDRTLDKDVAGTLAKGIRYGADNGAQVIAVHLSVYERSLDGGAVQAAVEHARRKNAVVVAASGSLERYDRLFPVAAAGVLGVGAVAANGRRYKTFTDPSSAITVAAPGFDHPAIGPRNTPYVIRGDAPAMLWATATAAMIKSEYPKLTPTQVVQAIASSARHPKGKGRYDTDLGYGYLNAAGALKAAEAMSEKEAPPPPEPAVKDASYLGGEPPGPVRAVPYDPAILGGFGGLMGAGLIATIAGLWLLIRRPRRPAAPAPATGPLPFGGPPHPGGTSPLDVPSAAAGAPPFGGPPPGEATPQPGGPHSVAPRPPDVPGPEAPTGDRWP